MEQTNMGGHDYEDTANNKKDKPNQPVCNSEYDRAILRSDVLCVTPGQCYKLVITFEKGDCNKRITPTVTIPNKDGYIKIPGQKRLFMFSPCNNSSNPRYEMLVMSQTGKIDISYHCEIKDHRGISYLGSSKMLRRSGMRLEVLAPRKNRYYCTDELGERFDCYVFTVEWEHINGQ